MIRVLILFFFLIQIEVQCQVVADFNLKAQACLSEKIELINESSNATQYEWDLCAGELTATPTVSIFDTANGAPFKLKLVQEGDEYFGFYTVRSSNKLIRLDYGDNINNPSPEKVDLGNMGTDGFSSAALLTIDIVKEGNQYYGFIADFSNRIFRIAFGNSIKNQPSNVELIYTNGLLNNPIDLLAIKDGSGSYVFITNYSSGSLVRLNLGVSFGAMTSSIVSSAITDSSLSPGQRGISTITENSQSYLIISTDSNLIRVYFDNGLSAAPTLTTISGVPVSTGFRGLSVVFDNSTYFVFVQSSTHLYRLELGSSVANGALTSSDLGGFGLFGNVWGFSMTKVKSDWLVFSSENSNTNNIYKILFPENCPSQNKYSTEVNPVLIPEHSGTFSISLTANNNNLEFNTQSKTLVVSADQAPQLSFVTQNICVESDILFTSVSDIELTAIDWFFGDLQTAAQETPSHRYLASGMYNVRLEAEASNSCQNFFEKTVQIYDAPSSSFTSPTGLICTNNEFTFTNTTTDNYDGNLSYQWFVQNTPTSTQRDLKYTFASGGDQNIKLEVSIPGCTNDITHTMADVQAGPVVGFSQAGQCEGNEILFSNSSSGSISGYIWNFGNGNSSTEMSPVQTYPTKGTYNIFLETTGTNGCVSTLSKTLTIYSKPQPDFSLELPPFSCTGTPSQFTNTTSNPTDSNIASWAWQFGDEANGNSTVKDPLYTFSNSGNYDVTLSATTNFNCSTEITKTVTITQAPSVGFTNVPACPGQGTRFADASGDDVKSWLWKIGNSTYAFSNPTHVFASPGSYNVQLTVTGNNDCIATLSKTIAVPNQPTLDFSLTNACEGQAITFQDASPLAADPVASQSWDFVGNIKNGSPVQYTFDIAGTYAVKMTSTQQSGCVYSVSKNVVINPTPIAKFSTNPEWGVPPLKVQFTNQSTGAASYLWRFNDKNSSTSTDVSPDFQFTDLGDYVVDLIATSAQGCSNTISSKISVIIPSLDLELKELNLIKDPTSGAYRIMVTIKNRSNFVLTSADVIVDISGNARIKETIATTILPDGEVSQLLTNQVIPGNLFTYLCAEIDVANDLNAYNNKMCESVSNDGVIFSPYPNPSNGEFRFDWISSVAGEAHFIINNSMGQLVFQQDVTVTGPGLNQAYFDLKSFNEGMYFFKFIANDNSKTIPIIIAR